MKFFKNTSLTFILLFVIGPCFGHLKKTNIEKAKSTITSVHNLPINDSLYLNIDSGKELYEFDLKMKMVFKQFKKNKLKRTTPMTMRYGSGAALMVLDQGKATTIIDYQNRKAISIQENKNIAMVLPTLMMNKMVKKMSEKQVRNIVNGQVEIIKTEETKVISDYNCIKYHMISDEGKIDLWRTTEITYDFSSFEDESLQIFGSLNAAAIKNMFDDNGFVLEYMFYNDHGQRSGVMTIAEFVEEPFKINLNNYELINVFGN